MSHLFQRALKLNTVAFKIYISASQETWAPVQVQNNTLFSNAYNVLLEKSVNC